MARESRIPRAERIRLAIEATDRVDEYLSGMDKGAFLASRLHQDAVCMQIMHIAELLKPLDDASGSLRHDLPEVGSVLGMRNVIAHQYLTIDD